MGLPVLALKAAVMVVAAAVAIRVSVLGTGRGWSAEDIPPGPGKVMIVTGSNTGLGLATVKHFAEHEFTVVMACRNLKKAEAAAQQLREQGVKGKILTEELNLAEPQSIEKFAQKFAASYDRLDVLVNNAGIMSVPEGRNSKGWENQIATNHLGHFILTGRLMPLLKKSKGRVVNHSSSMAFAPGYNVSDLLWTTRPYNAVHAYSATKTANLLFTFELNRRFSSEGVTATAAHPGGTRTDLQIQATGDDLFHTIANAGRPLYMTPEVGCLSQDRAAVDSEPDTFWGPAWIGFGPPIKLGTSLKNIFSASMPDSTPQGAKALWELSEVLTGVSY